MCRLILYLVLSLIAGIAPLAIESSQPTATIDTFPGWPSEFDGKPIQPLPLGKKERLFLKSFPGKVARFTDGHREYILRWMTQSTRKLHSASDCLRGVGYQIQSRSIELRQDNRAWAVFQARNAEDVLRVYERTYDNSGNSWTDVSAWYWSALLGGSTGPWWSVTIAEKWSPPAD